MRAGTCFFFPAVSLAARTALTHSRYLINIFKCMIEQMYGQTKTMIALYTSIWRVQRKCISSKLVVELGYNQSS